MDRELVERWVAALESGEYKRGSGALHLTYNGEHRFCCLGVLADIVNPDGWVLEGVVVEPVTGQIREEVFGYLYSANCNFLPGGEPWQPDHETQYELSTLNDDAENDDTSYEAVLPWIRQNLL